MKRELIINTTNGKEYVLQGYVVGEWYLIPFVPHWNSPSPPETDLWKKYWEPHYAKRDTWIPISQVNFNNWSITETQYLEEKAESEMQDKEILAKYYASF